MASSPSLPKPLEGSSGHIEFKRMVSGASTCLPSPGASTCLPSPSLCIDFQDLDRQVSEAPDIFNSPASQTEADHLLFGVGHTTSDSDVADLNICDDKEHYLDDDGALWVQTTAEDETYDGRLQRCQKSLHELNSLFAERYGYDIDDVDEDGTVWIRTAGCSIMEKLEEKLAEVKCLYHEKFGADAGSEDDAYDSQLQRSEKSLQELKVLFVQKYGFDIDDVDEDGTVWIKTAGCSVVEKLEEKLAEVKCLYYEKFGTNIGSEGETYDLDGDGCVWIETSGRSHMEILEDKLVEVKHLYDMKFGSDMTSDTELQPLQAKLDTVKALFYKKYGHDVDVEEI